VSKHLRFDLSSCEECFGIRCLDEGRSKCRCFGTPNVKLYFIL